MERMIQFKYFRYATDFIKEIGTGKITRNTENDNFIWSSEGAIFNEEQEALISDYDGKKYVWWDQHTDLTWLLNTNRYGKPNDTAYGGHNDWRSPTLRELKTLSSHAKNQFGVYVKKELEGRISGNYHSCTTLRYEELWWNFNENKYEQEKVTEGSINWGSEGEYLGVDRDIFHNSARNIYVRGENEKPLVDWVKAIVEWAESEGEYNLPVTQENLESLEEITLYYAKKIPPEFLKLPRLKRVVCRYSLGMVPVFLLDKLEELELLETYPATDLMRSLPDEIASLRSLVKLKATYLRLSTISKEIGKLHDLESLDLAVNSIESIPDTIGQLNKLQLLRVCGSFSCIPASIGSLVNLKTLLIRSENLECIPDSIGELQKLEELILSGKFTSIPRSIFDLKALKRLAINSYGELESIPIGLYEYGVLQDLEISNSRLTSFPDALLNLNHLKKLKLTNAPISFIPWDIEILTGLTHLDLSGTQVSELPKSLLQLEQLEVLSLPAGVFKEVPGWLVEMTSLRHINAKETIFPPELRKMRGR